MVNIVSQAMAASAEEIRLLRAEVADLKERYAFLLSATRGAQAYAGTYADEVMELRASVNDLKTQAMFSRSTIERMQMQIDALTTERDRMRKALHLIVAAGSDDTYAVGIARAALGVK